LHGASVWVPTLLRATAFITQKKEILALTQEVLCKSELRRDKKKQIQW